VTVDSIQREKKKHNVQKKQMRHGWTDRRADIRQRVKNTYIAAKIPSAKLKTFVTYYLNSSVIAGTTL